MVTVANFGVLSRLLYWQLSVNRKRLSNALWQTFKTASEILPSLGAAPIILYCLGLSDLTRFFSAQPIKGVEAALDRILYFERGIQMVFIGDVVELLCLGMCFLAVGLAFFACGQASARQHSQADELQPLFFATSVVNLIALGRGIWKLVSSPAAGIRSGNDILVTHGPTFWLLDVLPTLLGIVMLCMAQPGQYLPEKFTRVLLDEEEIVLDYTVLTGDEKMAVSDA